MKSNAMKRARHSKVNACVLVLAIARYFEALAHGPPCIALLPGDDLRAL